jgi:hypothetical protein
MNSENEHQELTTNGNRPPGASTVKCVQNRGTGWYCDACAAFIRPIWIREGKTVFPACRECFYDDLPVFKTDLIVGEEVPDVPLLEGVVVPPEAAPRVTLHD